MAKGERLLLGIRVAGRRRRGRTTESRLRERPAWPLLVVNCEGD